MSGRQLLWWRILVADSVLLVVFGLVLVIFPGITLQAFGLLVYSSATQLSSFGPEAVVYIQLVHAVLGAVMVGWGTVLLVVALGPVRHGSKDGWFMFVVSLCAWFIPDTAYSLLTGFWQNAVLNAVFSGLFAAPLIALRPFVLSKRSE